MSDVVYVVTETSGDYEDRETYTCGVFTNLEDAKACKGDNYDRDIETWSTGEDSAHQERTLHTATRQVANPNFNVYTEVVWETVLDTREVDASEPVDRYDGQRRTNITRGGWTVEEAALRLNEALETFEPDLTPVPVAYRWPEPRKYTLSDLMEIRLSMHS